MQNEPALIKGVDVGDCTSKWDPEYLAGKLEDKKIIAHVSSEEKLDFINKNFKYEKMDFQDFINRAQSRAKGSLYLRSTGDDRRGRDVSDLSKNFPQIASDFKIPSFLDISENSDVPENSTKEIFSSVLRISSASMTLWTHYDIMDNILVHISGHKRVTLFSPEDIEYLYIKGDKSLVLDIDDLNTIDARFPLFHKAKRYVSDLAKGDILFIPSLWFHNVFAETFSISVNIFWKDNCLKEHYDQKDVYGNKDLLPAAKAFKNVENACNQLKILPEKFQKFYLEMMIIKIKENFENKL